MGRPRGFLPFIFLMLTCVAAGPLLAAQCLVGPLAAADGAQTGDITDVTPQPDKLWPDVVQTKKGLFRVARDGRISAIPLEGAVKLEAIDRIYPLGARGFVLIQTGNDLFRLGVDGHISRIPKQNNFSIPTIDFVGAAESDGTVLLGAENTLFRLEPDGYISRISTSGDVKTGRIDFISRAKANGTRLLGTDKGVFRLAPDGHLDRLAVQGKVDLGYITSFPEPDSSGANLIGAEFGLFRLSYNGLIGEISPSYGELGQVDAIADPDPDGSRLIAAVGFFRLAPNGDLSPIPTQPDVAIGRVDWIPRPDPDGSRLLGTAIGLFRLKRDGRLGKVVANQSDIEPGRIEFLSEPGPDASRFVVGEHGVFRLTLQPVMRAKPAEASVGTDAGRPTLLSWKISGECARFARAEEFELRAASGKDTVKVVSQVYDPANASLQLLLPPTNLSAKKVVQLGIRGTSGSWHPIGAPVTLSPVYSFEQILKISTTAAGILHTLFFVGLIVASRWSSRAVSMLCDPVARTVGLWWGFALAYSPSLQHWVLGRWFDRRMREARGDPFLPLPVTNRSTGETIGSDQLSKRLRPTSRVWLQGKPGMGKTVLARALELSFFNQEGGAVGLRQRGYIPLFVPLRALSGAAPGDGDLLWCARVAEMVFAGQDFILDRRGASGSNLRLISAILDHAGFVLLLDGANEVPWSDQIATAAVSRDRPGLFVTSQGPPPPGAVFEHWTLPDTVADAIAPLLRLFMGAAAGDALFQKLQASPLISDIRSGYDVRLLQRLFEADGGPLPESRIGLFSAMVARSTGNDSEAKRSLAAFAWARWLNGEHQFRKTDIGTALADRLFGSDVRIMRETGDRIEFIHGQIAAYLAACHILDTVNPAGFIANAEPEWRRIIRPEQAELWGFISDMVTPDLGAHLYRWALKEPDDRIELQKALKKRIPISE